MNNNPNPTPAVPETDEQRKAREAREARRAQSVPVRNRILVLALIFLAVLVAAEPVSAILGSLTEDLQVVRFDFADLFRLPLMAIGMFILADLFRLFFINWAPKSHGAQTFASLARSIVHYVIAIVGLVWGLAILGVDVKSLIAGAGIVALIIGFGAESLIADIVTGVFMLFDAQFSVGDIIVIGDFRGTVVDIGIRTTKIRDTGGNIKIVNNSDIRNIVNRSANRSVAVSDFTVCYDGATVRRAEEIILAKIDQLYREHGDLFNEPPRYLGVNTLAAVENLVYLRVVANVDEAAIFSVQRMLNREIFLALEDAGISNPALPVELTGRS